MLNIIKGGRDEFEARLLKEIWLGSLEEADRMITQLQNLPKPSLHLVNAHSTNGPLSPAPENG